ncbi:pentatricopeptide repeat-containing protein At3g26540-like [Asparagus officinalis]|uniref:pentatricopeptide repeat-containing protein At3g26540-like n=1 Tax=Asparagus officinalis TaxID=4686 RepID=UPI00098E724B|nr:pentatricopeptide repeat-containing protein At3g26540-like [Asparagus officinalis]
MAVPILVSCSKLTPPTRSNKSKILKDGNLIADPILKPLKPRRKISNPSLWRSSPKSLIEARRIESHIVSTSNLSPPIFLLNRVIETYSNLGSLKDAQELFDEMPDRNTGSYNAIITGYAREGKNPERALYFFSRMNSLGFGYTGVTFASVLRACSDVLDLGLARQVHGMIEKLGFCGNFILETALVDVYGKCAVIGDARRMFDLISEPNEVTWNVIVRRYLEMEKMEEAICMFFRMVSEGFTPINHTVMSALKACSSVIALDEGRRVHGVVVKIGYKEDNIVENCLMEMYLKCGVVEDAFKVFEDCGSKCIFSWTMMINGHASCGDMDMASMLFNEMPEKNVVSWNTMLTGFVKLSRWEKGLDFFYRMRRETKEMDEITLGLVLTISSGLLDLGLGKQVHGFAYRHSLISNMFFCNSLLDMYTKCGNLRSSELWFVQMDNLRDRVSWNSLLSGYARNGRSEEALNTFRLMLWETNPNEKTLSAVLVACANVFALEFGKQIHAYMFRNGFEDVVTRGVLVDMYSKCNLIDYAIKVFDCDSSRDTVLWNSMILGCAYNGRGEHGLKLFETMKEDGIKPDNITFTGVLLSCISEGYVNLGQSYFASMVSEFGIIPRIEHYACMTKTIRFHSFRFSELLLLHR